MFAENKSENYICNFQIYFIGLFELKIKPKV